MLAALEYEGINDKHLFGSLFGNGSIPLICAIIGVAIVAGIIIYIQKNKKNK